MFTLSTILIAVLALIHAYIVVLEMALWTAPRTRAAFGTTPELAEATKVLAGNQGLYNGFLVAGLVWSLLAPAPLTIPLRVFFAACVLVAGLYGGFTVGRRILLVQALPGALALVATLLA